MKTRMILTGIAAAVLLTAPLAAQAADLAKPRYEAPPAYEAPSYASWTGFYVGINGGYGFGTSDWNTPAVSVDPQGGLVGGTIGYNYQTGSWVWGLEGDFDWADIKGDTTCGLGTCETKSDWFATARLRVGYGGSGNWLPYITGGAAFADVKATNSLLTSASKNMFGWTVGAGVEYAMVTNWSVKVEYLYADLGSFDCGVSCSATVPDNVDFTINIVRAGVNYRF
jgi:outer membrane immunogenic protein